MKMCVTVYSALVAHYFPNAKNTPLYTTKELPGDCLGLNYVYSKGKALIKKLIIRTFPTGLPLTGLFGLVCPK